MILEAVRPIAHCSGSPVVRECRLKHSSRGERRRLARTQSAGHGSMLPG